MFLTDVVLKIYIFLALGQTQNYYTSYYITKIITIWSWSFVEVLNGFRKNYLTFCQNSATGALIRYHGTTGDMIWRILLKIQTKTLDFQIQRKLLDVSTKKNKIFVVYGRGGVLCPQSLYSSNEVNSGKPQFRGWIQVKRWWSSEKCRFSIWNQLRLLIQKSLEIWRAQFIQFFISSECVIEDAKVMWGKSYFWDKKIKRQRLKHKWIIWNHLKNLFLSNYVLLNWCKPQRTTKFSNIIAKKSQLQKSKLNLQKNLIDYKYICTDNVKSFGQNGKSNILKAFTRYHHYNLWLSVFPLTRKLANVVLVHKKNAIPQYIIIDLQNPRLIKLLTHE